MKHATGASGEILDIALKGLEVWENDGVSVDDYLDSTEVAESGFRRAVSSILFGYFRNKPLLDALIGKFAANPRPRYRRIMSIAAVQALFQDGIAAESAVNIAVGFTRKRFGAKPAGFINAVLRRIIREDAASFFAELPEWGQFGIPEALYLHWVEVLGLEQCTELAGQFKAKPEFTFRLCGELEQKKLDEVGAVPLELDWAPDFKFFTCSDPGKLLDFGWTDQGLIYIQDPSTALSVSMIDFSKDIKQAVDLCAAPGGKSLMIAERLPAGAELTASDRSARRQKLTRKNFEDHDFAHHQIVVASALELPFGDKSFDLVFLDVPCSNSGVFKRRPDALWRYSPGKLTELVDLQRDILAAGSRLLRSGGQLVYSTCSIEPREDQEQVAEFLKNNPAFKLVKERMLFPGPGHDGAYAALLSLN